MKTRHRTTINRHQSTHTLASQNESQRSGSLHHDKSTENADRKSLNASKLRPIKLKQSNHPYEHFIREMKIKLPTPYEKFIQFLRIPPFNRISSHLELIAHFLKDVAFFKVHSASPTLLANFARKIKILEEGDKPEEKMILVVLEGQCKHGKDLFTAGCLVNRRRINFNLLHLDTNCKMLYMMRHEYMSFVSTYLQQETIKYSEFLRSIQTLKVFSPKIFQRFIESLSIHFFLKGQQLYKPGQEADLLFIVYKGKVARRVIIELQKMNKIPSQKFTKILRVISKSYAHKIEFGFQDIVGVSELVDSLDSRKEEIFVEEDSVLLGIDRATVQQHMDEYIRERFRKYNLKKYPANYDQLCDNYLKTKLEIKKTEEMKISALKTEMNKHLNVKKREKIEQIIRQYEDNIKNEENRNLLKNNLKNTVIKNK